MASSPATPISTWQKYSQGSERGSVLRPAPGELVDAASRADQGDGVVILTISRHMSSSYEAARLAAGLLEEQGTGREKVAVVDTGTAAGAEGLVVLAASRAARSGLPVAGVVAAAEGAAGGRGW